MHGKQSVGSVRGESSHQEHPFIALLSENATQDTGEVYGMHFVSVSYTHLTLPTILRV